MEASINALVHRATLTDGPYEQTIATYTPGECMDEVFSARGNKASLDARLAGVIDDDGVIITPSSVVSQDALKAEAGAGVNLTKNSTFFLWSAGSALAPDYWALSGSTVAIEATTIYVGKKAVALTNTGTLTQTIIDATDWTNFAYLKAQTKKVGMGCWVWASIASHASILVDDGNLQTESDYHTGGSGWEWISLSHTLSAAATKLDIQLKITGNGTAYFSGVHTAFMDNAPALYLPEPVQRGSIYFQIPGAMTTGDGKKYISFTRPTRVDNVQVMFIGGDPTGAAINMDFEKYEPTATWVSFITGTAIVADGDAMGNAQPAGDYHDRCVAALHQGSGELIATAQENKIMRVNIDQIGSTLPGTDMVLRFDCVQASKLFEQELSYDFQGV
jgi:hypothetical protein